MMYGHQLSVYRVSQKMKELSEDCIRVFNSASFSDVVKKPKEHNPMTLRFLKCDQPVFKIEKFGSYFIYIYCL